MTSVPSCRLERDVGTNSKFTRMGTTQALQATHIVFYESQPGSWLVAICERSENRGSGGG